MRGLPELAIGGLADATGLELVRAVLPDKVDERVLERLVAETHGNPLALLELPGGLTPAQLAGGFALPSSLPIAGRIEARFSPATCHTAVAVTALVARCGGGTDRRPGAGVEGCRAARRR